MTPRAPRPSLWTRLRIRAAGEIPIDDLRAYRTASLEVWTFVEQVAERRRTREVAPVENLGAWIVFGLQTYGNALMDADAHADPSTAGAVPPLTHALVLSLYQPIGPWLVRAHEGRGNPEMGLRRRTPLAFPATPPALSEDVVGINALLIAVRAMAGELPFVATDPPSTTRARIEAALASARYAEGLLPSGGTLGTEDLARLGPPLRQAAGELFRAGQIAAWPEFNIRGTSPKAARTKPG